ncbi:hypothetical protein ACLUTX_19700 [Enterobacterales bacterium AE_CKDN230030158-1A_HGKHYDSX7]
MEALLQQAQSVLGSGYSVLVIAALVFAKTISTLGSAFDFHDKNFVQKRFKRLNELRAGVKKDDRPLAQYLDDAIELEAFRVASGVTASKQKMVFLVEIASLGLWNRTQLRWVAKHLEQGPQDATPVIRITRLDWVGAAIGLISLFYCITAGIFFFAYISLTTPMPYGLVLGLLAFGGLVILARLLGEDFFSAKCANNVRKYLERKEASKDNGPSASEYLPNSIRADCNSTVVTVTEPL